MACAKRVGPRLAPGHDYLYPRWQAGELRPEESREFDRAWRDVLGGKAGSAEKRFARLLAQRPGMVPAQTGLAYALLRAGRLEEALRQFEDAALRQPGYPPALAGAGLLAFRLGDAERALIHYRGAQAADPAEPVVRRRLAQVKLQVTEKAVAAAHEALAAGRREAAVEAYRKALDAAPELGSLRIELAEVLIGEGSRTAARQVLEGDPAEDRQVLVRLAQLLIELGEHGRAIATCRRVLARTPQDAEALRLAHQARQSLELAQMPKEYARIPAAERVTRADLAALISAKVSALARVDPGEPRVVVDISGSWARPHILRVLAWDVIPVYPNHTFQPGAVVRKGDLSHAVARVLDLVKWPATPAPELSDMSRNNVYFASASRAVAAGLMDVTPDGGFEAWRIVTGSEAVAIIEALARLVGP